MSTLPLRSRLSVVLAKVAKPEYWPWYLIYGPLLPIYLCYSVRLRSIVWFTNVNPSIPLSGFFGESKIEILNKIPEQYKPRTLFLEHPIAAAELIQLGQAAGIGFPFILKPDEGERGNGVEKIENSKQLVQYLHSASWPLIMQEFIEAPLEFGVFFAEIRSEERRVGKEC